MRELTQVGVAQGLEETLLARVSDKMLRFDGELTRDNARHRLETFYLCCAHRSPLTGRLGGFLRGGGRSLGVGGGLGGRFNFWPRDFFAFSDGVGPRASGFFIAMRALLPFHYGCAAACGRFCLATILFFYGAKISNSRGGCHRRRRALPNMDAG
jgi:hypothetical protein